MRFASNSLVARNPLARRVWQAKRFAPDQVPGLGLDLDASYGVLNSIGPDVPATNGQAVRRWLDKSGNGRHFDQATATNQPVFSSAGFNSRSCVYFDGVDDLLTCLSGLGLLRSVAGATLITVFYPDAYNVVPSETVLAIMNNAGFNRAAIDRVVTNDGDVRVGGRRLDADANAFVLVGKTVAPIFVTGVFDYSAAVLRGYQNGAIVSSLSPFQTAGNTSATDSSIFRLGNIFRGKIARVLVWPRALTASELLRVHRYLSATYGIPLAP